MSNKRISYKEKRDGGRKEGKKKKKKEEENFLNWVDLFCESTFGGVHESLYSCQHMSIMTQRLMM